MGRKWSALSISLSLLIGCSQAPTPDSANQSAHPAGKTVPGGPQAVAQRDKTGGQGRQRQLALNLGLPGWPTFKHTPRKPFSNARPARPDELRPAIPDGPPPSLQLQSQALSASSGTINVFYSDPLPASSPYRDGGRVHAIHLANLLGHFPGYQIVVKRISEYRAGDASASVRTFYIGTVFDEVMPASFLDETAQGAPVTWINYNIWQLGEKLPTRLGLQYVESIFATGGEEKPPTTRLSTRDTPTTSTSRRWP